MRTMVVQYTFQGRRFRLICLRVCKWYQGKYVCKWLIREICMQMAIKINMCVNGYQDKFVCNWLFKCLK